MKEGWSKDRDITAVLHANNKDELKHGVHIAINIVSVKCTRVFEKTFTVILHV